MVNIDTARATVPTPTDRAVEAAAGGRLRTAYRRAKKMPLVGTALAIGKEIVLEYLWAPEIHRKRVRAVLESPDFQRIPKVPNAGTIVAGELVLHNGVKVLPGSYYGSNFKYVLRRTQGVHEPRQEYLFQQVLKSLDNQPTMLELGSYWAFYSIWFKTANPDSLAVMVEPDRSRMAFGEKNFALNALSGVFLQAYVGEAEAQAEDGICVTSVDAVCRDKGIEHLAILHSDIQGAEADMIRGAQTMLRAGAIDNLFISTHAPELHCECISLLQGFGYEIVESIEMDSSDSEDGLVFARRSKLPHLILD